MLAFWFSLGVNTAYFLADVFIKLGSYTRHASRLVFYRSVYTVLLTLIWLFISGETAGVPNENALLQLTGCSVLCAIGLYYYIRSIQHLHFVNVAVVGITGALIHYLLGVWVNNETMNSWFYVSAIISISGIVIQWRKTENHKGLLEAVISAITWGFGYALLSIPLETTSAAWGTMVTEIITHVLSLGFILVREKNIRIERKEIVDWKIIGAALFTGVGSVWINIAYQKFSLNVLGFMQLAFFPYSLIAGYFIFKEKLSKVEWIGNLFVVLGLILYFFTCT